MHTRQSFAVLALCLLVLLSPAVRAAGVVQHVPQEALGFVVVKHLAATDDKLERLLTTIEADFPAPLAFLQAATGVSDGLDPQGDLLFVVLPGARPPQSKLQFAVWLPVQDYDRLVATLGGAPDQKIAGVTIAGGDVLVAHHGRWALVMDPDGRQRMEQMLAEEPNPPAAVMTWSDSIDAHDVTAVALPTGVQAILAWAAAASPAAQRDPAEQDSDQLFEFGQVDDPDDPLAAAPKGAATPNGIAETARAAIRKWATAAPRLSHVMLRARLIGCAMRLDDDGNLQSRLRIQSDERLWSRGDDEHHPPPSLYQGGSFVLHGGGDLHPGLAAIAAAGYAQALADELKNEEHMVLPHSTVTQFVQAAERVGAAVQSAVVLTQPGDKQEGVYTNDFLAVRAASARAFADNAKEVMRLWNSMNRDAQAETRLVFDVEEVTFGDRIASQYSLDVAAADGAAELPEIRQAMEKFFGPGGKLRLWIVPVDDQTVLLATATPGQVAAALEALDRKQSVDWNRTEIANVNERLPADADWRLFFSPHHYNTWHRREMDAITGPVIGGPLVKEFPPAPPIGLAGGIRKGELWIDAAVPAATIESAAAYREK